MEHKCEQMEKEPLAEIWWEEDEWWLGLDHRSGTSEIKYCPFCGQELAKEERT